MVRRLTEMERTALTVQNEALLEGKEVVVVPVMGLVNTIVNGRRDYTWRDGVLLRVTTLEKKHGE